MSRRRRGRRSAPVASCAQGPEIPDPDRVPGLHQLLDALDRVRARPSPPARSHPTPRLISAMISLSSAMPCSWLMRSASRRVAAVPRNRRDSRTPAPRARAAGRGRTDGRGGARRFPWPGSPPPPGSIAHQFRGIAAADALRSRTDHCWRPRSPIFAWGRKACARGIAGSSARPRSCRANSSWRKRRDVR